eukprot:jgi/Mesvir1/22248/Mv14382-RA.1
MVKVLATSFGCVERQEQGPGPRGGIETFPSRRRVPRSAHRSQTPFYRPLLSPGTYRVAVAVDLGRLQRQVKLKRGATLATAGNTGCVSNVQNVSHMAAE